MAAYENANKKNQNENFLFEHQLQDLAKNIVNQACFFLFILIFVSIAKQRTKKQLFFDSLVFLGCLFVNKLADDLCDDYVKTMGPPC